MLAPRRARISALHATARLGGAGPGGLVARSRVGAGARSRRAATSRGSASRGRCTASSPRRRRPRDPPAILWNDQRTAAECAEIEEPDRAERLIELTGNRALTGFTAPKLLWLRRHEPDAYARIARVLLPKDYVRLRLTGEWAIDASDASGTLLLDVARRALERRRARGARAPRRLAAAGARVDRRRPARPHGVRSRPAPATSPRRPRRRRRPARAGSPSSSGRRASCSRRWPRTQPTRRRACTRSATPCRRPGRRWA